MGFAHSVQICVHIRVQRKSNHGVSNHFRPGADIHTCSYTVGGKSMPQGMNPYPFHPRLIQTDAQNPAQVGTVYRTAQFIGKNKGASFGRLIPRPG